jgi:hypothetical protein
VLPLRALVLAYAEEAIHTHGALRGRSARGMARASLQPFARAGLDPVPPCAYNTRTAYTARESGLMDKRVMLAIVLCIGVVMAWTKLFPPPAPPPQAPAPATAPAPARDRSTPLHGRPRTPSAAAPARSRGRATSPSAR